MHLVSVLVPSYNHAKFIEARIDSIFGQTYKNFEVFVIDDASTDESVEKLSALRSKYDFNLIVRNSNSGSPFTAWETFANLANGEYFWICESDDVARDTFLEQMVKSFLTYNIGLAYCASELISETNSVIGQSFDYHSNHWKTNRWRREFFNFGINELLEYQIWGQTVPNMSSCLVSGPIFRNTISKFPLQKFRLSGDWLFIGLILNNANVYYTPQLLNQFRSHLSTSRARTKIDRTIQEFINV
jgi:glycosyltransferase involved in cell wall biosynthesis